MKYFRLLFLIIPLLFAPIHLYAYCETWYDTSGSIMTPMLCQIGLFEWANDIDLDVYNTVTYHKIGNIPNCAFHNTCSDNECYGDNNLCIESWGNNDKADYIIICTSDGMSACESCDNGNFLSMLLDANLNATGNWETVSEDEVIVTKTQVTVHLTEKNGACSSPEVYDLDGQPESAIETYYSCKSGYYVSGDSDGTTEDIQCTPCPTYNIYKDVTSNPDDYKKGLAACYVPGQERFTDTYGTGFFRENCYHEN